jgi:hypothetical protein
MLGPDGPHLFVSREFTAVSGGLGAGNRLALFGRKDNRRWNIGARKLHDRARDIVLIVRGVGSGVAAMYRCTPAGGQNDGPRHFAGITVTVHRHTSAPTAS